MMFTVRLLFVLLTLPTLVWGQAQLINGNRVHAGWVNYGITAGTTTAYTLTFTPAMPGYVPGQCFLFKPHATNTGPATLNVQGLGAKALTKLSGTSLVPVVAGDLLVNRFYSACYDGTDVQLMGTGTEAVGSGGHTIYDEGVARAAEPILNFVGTGISCVDSPGTSSTICTVSSGGDALTTQPLSQFAPTTSGQLAGLLTNETGTGAVVFGTAPVITAPTGIVKGDVGLGNVDNTSDATKPINFATNTVQTTLAQLNAAITDANVPPDTRALTVQGTTDEITCTGGAQDLTANRTWTCSFAAITDFNGQQLLLTRGTVVPGTCLAGQVFFDTDAPAGQNLYGCTATNIWTLLGDGTGAAGTVTVSGTPSTGQAAQWASGTAITGVDTTGTGNYVKSTAPVLSAPTGIVKGDVGLGNVDNTSDATKPINFATNTVQTTLALLNTAITDANVPPETRSVTVQGTTDEITCTGGTQDLSANRTWSCSFAAITDFNGQQLLLTRGTTVPGTCVLGQAFFDTDAPAGQNLYGCTATNTWTLLGGTGSGGHTIQDEGTARPARTNLNFTGAGVSCVDNAGANSTDCAVSGTGSGVGVSGTPVADQLAMWTNETTIKGISSLALTITDLDVATATRTRPNKVGTLPPATCEAGDTFYDSDAATSQKLLSCEFPPNGWEPVGGTGTGTGSGTVSAGTVGRVARYSDTTTVMDSAGLTLDATDVLTYSPKVTAISASMTPGAHNILACTSGTGTVVVTLPVSAAAVAKRYVMVKVDTGSGVCRVAPASGEQLNWVVNGTQDATRQGDSVSATLLAPTFWLAEQTLTAASLATIPEVRSFAVPAGNMEATGGCTFNSAATLVTNGPKVTTIACTDTDTDKIEFSYPAPDGWNAGTITLDLAVFYSGTTHNLQTFALNFSGYCVSPGDTVTAFAITSGATIEGTGNVQALVTASAVANRYLEGTTLPLTLAGTCAPGDTVFIHGLVDAAATTWTTFADLKILSAKVEWTRVSND